MESNDSTPIYLQDGRQAFLERISSLQAQTSPNPSLGSLSPQAIGPLDTLGLHGSSGSRKEEEPPTPSRTAHFHSLQWQEDSLPSSFESCSGGEDFPPLAQPAAMAPSKESHPAKPPAQQAQAISTLSTEGPLAEAAGQQAVGQQQQEQQRSTLQGPCFRGTGVDALALLLSAARARRASLHLMEAPFPVPLPRRPRPPVSPSALPHLRGCSSQHQGVASSPGQQQEQWMPPPPLPPQAALRPVSSAAGSAPGQRPTPASAQQQRHQQQPSRQQQEVQQLLLMLCQLRCPTARVSAGPALGHPDGTGGAATPAPADPGLRVGQPERLLLMGATPACGKLPERSGDRVAGPPQRAASEVLLFPRASQLGGGALRRLRSDPGPLGRDMCGKVAGPPAEAQPELQAHGVLAEQGHLDTPEEHRDTWPPGKRKKAEELEQQNEELRKRVRHLQCTLRLWATQGAVTADQALDFLKSS